MATQAQRRREAIAAVKSFQRVYRKADSLGELLERELKRLGSRKTLIGVDQMGNLSSKLDAYARQVADLQKAYTFLWTVVRLLPS